MPLINYTLLFKKNLSSWHRVKKRDIFGDVQYVYLVFDQIFIFFDYTYLSYLHMK